LSHSINWLKSSQASSKAQADNTAWLKKLELIVGLSLKARAGSRASSSFFFIKNDWLDYLMDYCADRSFFINLDTLVKVNHL